MCITSHIPDGNVIYFWTNVQSIRLLMEKIKISDIKPNPNNPRIITEDNYKKLVKSIQEFPTMLNLRPLVVDENNFLLGGNMRLRALTELQYNAVPVERFTRTQAEAMNKATGGKKTYEEYCNEFVIKDNSNFGIVTGKPFNRNSIVL